MKIAIDLDGVIYHWDKTARYMLRTQRGCKGLNKPSPHWNYIEEQVSEDDWEWLWTEGVRLGLFRYGHLITGAIEGVRALATAGHTLVVVTHRPVYAVKDTVDFLSYIDLPFDGYHILSNGEPKSTVRADVLIDDKPSNVIQWASQYRNALIFSQPWNQNANFLGYDLDIGRVLDWPDAVRELTS